MGKQPVTKEEIMEDALKDPDFKKKLKESPKAALTERYKISIPEGIDLIVIEETKDRWFLIIPHQHDYDSFDNHKAGQW